MSCETVRGLLPLHAGHDLPEADGDLVEKHVSSCISCSRELEEYAGFLATLRAPSGHELQLSPGARRSVAVAAAEAHARGGRWHALLPGIALRRGLLAAAASLILLTGLHLTFREEAGKSPAAGHGGESLRVAMDGGEVRLAWDNGSRASYRVFKSRDPRVFNQFEVFEVSGTGWTDPDPGSSEVVFYRVE